MYVYKPGLMQLTSKINTTRGNKGPRKRKFWRFSFDRDMKNGAQTLGL